MVGGGRPPKEVIIRADRTSGFSFYPKELVCPVLPSPDLGC